MKPAVLGFHAKTFGPFAAAESVVVVDFEPERSNGAGRRKADGSPSVGCSVEWESSGCARRLRAGSC